MMERGERRSLGKSDRANEKKAATAIEGYIPSKSNLASISSSLAKL